MLRSVDRAAATTLTSAADALRDEEVDRTRTFLRMGWIVAVGTVVAVLVVPGDRRIAAALLASLGVALAGSVWLYRRLGTASTTDYQVRQLHVLAFAVIVCGQLGTLYVGVFSAAPLI